jgi:hypothetical protein
MALQNIGNQMNLVHIKQQGNGRQNMPTKVLDKRSSCVQVNEEREKEHHRSQ